MDDKSTDSTYEFQSGPIKPTYTLQPVNPRVVDLDDNFNSHPLFMDSVPTDERGKGFVKLFAALSEGLVPVDADDGASPQADTGSIRYDTLEDHITEERLQRRERFAQVLEQRRHEMQYLDRLGPRPLARTRKRRASDTGDTLMDGLPREDAVSECLGEQSTVAADIDEVSQVSRDGIDNTSVASLHSVVSEGAVLAMAKRRRVENLRRHLEKREENERRSNVDCVDSDSDDSDEDLRQDTCSQVSELRHDGDRMVLLSAPAFRTIAPTLGRSSRSMHDERISDNSRASTDESIISEQELQANAAQRVKTAETLTSLKFLNM